MENLYKIANTRSSFPMDFTKAGWILIVLVSKSCRGEFGGTIKFKSKKTGIEYCCASTCPVVVNKVSGKYIVTNTLAHMRGFSELIEIIGNEITLMRYK